MSTDVEVLVVAAAEIEAFHGFPIETDSIASELQSVVELLKEIPTWPSQNKMSETA